MFKFRASFDESGNPDFADPSSFPLGMIDHHIDAARHLVITRVAGRVSLGDVAGHLQRVMRDPKFNPDFNALVVAADATVIPSTATMELLAPVARMWSHKRAGAKWAFVVPDAAKAQAESALHALRLTAVVTRCFSSEGAAFVWLESGVTAAIGRSHRG